MKRKDNILLEYLDFIYLIIIGFILLTPLLIIRGLIYIFGSIWWLLNDKTYKESIYDLKEGCKSIFEDD